MQHKSGKIISFYSYKGGTGRSMLLANMAWILASNGHKVLVIDWDLEAPGLHRYFAPFLPDKDLETSDGVIDFVIDFVQEANAIGKSKDKNIPEDWYAPFANITSYASSLEYEFPKNGTIDFVPAGRQNSEYATKVNLFDWQDFYERYGGGVLLEATKKIIRDEYDYILIDSRTGVSDTSGICTVQLPDFLVILYTLNNQSMLGAAAVAQSVQNQNSTISIFPVTARIDDAEKVKVETRLSLARSLFAPFIKNDENENIEKYWRDAEIPYIPYYSYEEVLSVFADRVRKNLVSPVESITRRITGINYKMPDIPDEKRKSILSQYSRLGVQKLFPKQKEVFISYAWGGESEKVVNDIDQTFQNRGVTIVRDIRDLGYKGSINRFMETINDGKAVILVISDKYLKSESCMFEFLQVAENKEFADRVFPVVLENARIYNAVDRLGYVKYWERKLKELKEAMKTVDPANLQGIREDVDRYAEIRDSLPRLTDILMDMNALTPEQHREAGFSEIYDAVMAKIEE